MHSILYIAAIVNTVVLFLILLFFWIQFSSTDSKLVKLIESRIRLNNVNYDLDNLEYNIKEENDNEF